MFSKLLTLLVLAPMISASKKEGSYPAIIQKKIDQKSSQCLSEGKGRLLISKQAIQKLQLNDDGVVDFVVDASGFECTSSQSLQAGSEAFVLEIYLSEKNKKLKKAWSSKVLAYTVNPNKSRIVIEIRDTKDPLKVVKKTLLVSGTQVKIGL